MYSEGWLASSSCVVVVVVVGGETTMAFSNLILQEMNLPTASNILFLYNKVNSLLSPWRRTPAIVSQSSFQAGSYEFHLYAADSPCPNSAGFSRVSLLPRRDPSAT